MNKLLTFLLSLLACASFTQNYQVVHNHLPAYYQTAAGYNDYAIFKAFAIDSVATMGTDSLFYTFATIRDTTDPGWEVCLDAEAGSIIGRKILQQNNRTVLFNFRNDSIVIRHHSTPGEKWHFFTYTNGDHLEAFHVNTQLMDILGLPDSVKVITLLRKDADGNLIEDDINEVNLLLSKQYGLIQTIDFYIFPEEIMEYGIAGIHQPLTGLANLDAKGVYDFDIGDEFHFVLEDIFSVYDLNDSVYKILSGNTGRKIRYVTDRVDYTDSVTYTFTECEATIYYENYITDTIYTTETVTATYCFDSIRPGLLDAYPGQKIKTELWDLYYDISYFSIEKYNFHPQKGIVDHAFMKTDSCIIRSIFDPCCYAETYVQACGGPYFTWSDWFGQTNKELLVYFNKNGDTWGTPLASDCEELLSTVNEKPVNKTEVQVSPNPFTDRLQIAVSDRKLKIDKINLFGISGNLMSTFKVSDYTTNLSLSDLPGGVYLLGIKLDNGQLVIKKVVKSER